MRTLFFTFIILCTGKLFSQNEIRGYVWDTQGNPIAFVNILLMDATGSQLVSGTISDENGQFNLESTPVGSFFLKVTSLGFSDYTSDQIELNGTTLLELSEPIILQEDAQQLDEVELVGKKNLYERQVDRTVVNVQSSAINSGGTALSVIETSPGMKVNRIAGVIGMLGKDGTMVYVNGKRVRMTGSALVQMLDGLPASNIDKLELISNPPASFDADGVGGVVNIILKHESSDSGWSGTVSGTSGYGNNIKYGISSDLHQQGEKSRFFISINNNNNYNYQPTFVDKSYELNGVQLNEDLNGARDAFRGLTQFKIGGAFDYDSKTELGGELKFRQNVWKLDALSETVVNANGSTSYVEDLVSSEENNWNHYLGSIFIKHQLGTESDLSIEYDYLNYRNENDATYDETRLENDAVLTRSFISEAETAVDFNVARLDFNTAIGADLKLALGAKGTISKFTNEALVFDVDNGIPTRNDDLSETRSLDEDIWAGYTSLNIIVNKKVNADLGLRYEYTDSKLNSLGSNNDITINQGQLFPSLTLNYTLNDSWKTSLSYGERITRPDFSALAPAFYFFNSTTIYTGNPAIRPVTSRSLSTGLRHKKKMLTLNFTDETNPNAWRALSFSDDLSITIINPQPMEDRKLFSAILSFPLRILSRLKSNHTIGGFHQHEVPIYNDIVLTRNNWYFNLTSSFQYQFSNPLSADFSLNYISPRIIGLADSRASIDLNFGIAYTISSKWQFSLSIRDIINRNSFLEFDALLPQNNANLDWFYQDEGHIGTFALRYNFGNGTKRKQRRYGSQDEQNRLN